MFHNFIVLSVEPPPVANKECLCGDQANAFTAAVWVDSLLIHLSILNDHKHTWLSFPPDAIIDPSYDSLAPHTYCLWPQYLLTTFFYRIS